VAKKKVVTAKASKPASGATRTPKKKKTVAGQAKSAKKPAPRKKAPAASAPSSQRPLSNQQIGEVAGEIWHLLAEHGGQNVAAMKKSVDAPAELVLAAVGWLAREGKLDFVTSGRSVKVTLR
jgi:hypothetical protein